MLTHNIKYHIYEADRVESLSNIDKDNKYTAILFTILY